MTVLRTRALLLLTAAVASKAEHGPAKACAAPARGVAAALWADDEHCGRGSGMSLLQTNLDGVSAARADAGLDSTASPAASGTVAAGLLEASGRDAGASSPALAATAADASAGAAPAKQRSSRASGRAAAGHLTWRPKKARSTGSAFLYVLPVLGFALALAAIGATVLLEHGWPGGSPPAAVKRVGEAMHLGNLSRVYGGAVPHTPPRSARDLGGASALLGAHAGGPMSHGLQQLQMARYAQAPPVYAQPATPPEGPQPFPMMPPHGMPGAMGMPGMPGMAGMPAMPGVPSFQDPSQQMGPEVQIVVPTVPHGGVLGLNLSEVDLTVTGFAKVEASRIGFHVGDKLLALNGVPVKHQEDFVYWLKVAMDRNHAMGEPMVFTVWRHGGALGAQAVAADEDWVGTWEYKDPKLRSGAHQYTIRRTAGGMLSFEQQIPDGDAVHGALMASPGGALEANLTGGNGRPHGTVRLRLGHEGASIVSNLKRVGESDWGVDIAAWRHHAQTRHGAAGALPPPVSMA